MVGSRIRQSLEHVTETREIIIGFNIINDVSKSIYPKF